MSKKHGVQRWSLLIPGRLRGRTFLNAALVCVLTLSLFTGCATNHDVTSQARTKLGTVPEFHPELGLGALQGYLDPKTLPNSLELIPPPPAAGSAAFAHDKEVAQSTFALRDTPRFALAASDFDLKLPHLIDTFSCALNAQITEQNAPYLYTLLRRSFSDLALSTYTAKGYYKRMRPFQVNHEPMGVPEARAFLEKDPSYPSGHTAVGWGFALILTEISPDREDELLARGRAFGESRNIVNHHWNSDVQWGGFMGAATVARLDADPTFRADLEAARAEMAAIRAKGSSPTGDCKAEAAALAQGKQTDDVIAIDVLLQPDQTMITKANATNVRLRGNLPAGYELDATPAPHITLLQRFVRAKDLDAVSAAITKVIAAEHPTELQLKAKSYEYVMWGEVAVTVFVVERTPELMRLHQKVIDAVTPFAVSKGTGAAFDGTETINQETIGWVETFVPKSSGKNYLPHVTLGVAKEDFVKQMKAEPFESFTFKADGVAIYQLGNFGTAAKKLWQSAGK
jgi:acid phosphatase (class A)